jgi:hypothetical protein
VHGIAGTERCFPAAKEEHVEHFSAMEWVYFLRNPESAIKRVQMQEHLAQGCDECNNQVRVWVPLVEFALREPSYEPPASAVRIAKSYLFPFSVALKRSTQIHIVRHVFDSRDGGALNGIRGSRMSARQLLYNFSSVFVDLRMEQKPGSESLALTGQVVDASMADRAVGNVSVSLLRKRDRALETNTNGCGEFAFSLSAIGNMGLLVDLKDGALLLVFPESRVA